MGEKKPQERKEKLIRILQILQDTDSRSPMNATDIIQRLEEFNVGTVDRRAVYGDILMLGSCGYPIVKSGGRKKGWYWEKHAFEDWEVKVMMDAVEQARFLTVEDTQSIRKKLLKLISARGRKRFACLMDTDAGIRGEERQTGQFLELILEALYLGKKIRYQYTQVTDDLSFDIRRDSQGKEKEYVLNLYALHWSDNNYYLIGVHDHYDNITNYRLDRVRNLRIDEQDVIPAKEKLGEYPELAIQNYVKRSVGHFAGELVTVELEYTPGQITNAILYDFVGKDARVSRMPDGRARVRFRKYESVTLAAWVLQHADLFQVIQPQSLRNQVVGILQSSLELYGDTGKGDS